MNKRNDIYTKANQGDKTAAYEPLPPPDFKPSNRKAIILLVLMVVTLIAVVIYFNRSQSESSQSEFAHLLGRPEVSTNAVAVRPARASSDTASFESLLTDLGINSQAPPPTLSPQKMAESMSYIRSAQQYIRARDMEGGEREIMKALQVWPDMNIAIRLLGSIYTQRGQFDQAIVLLEKSLSKEPFSAEVLNNLAINYMQKGMMAKAEELLMTSLQIRQDYGVAYINLGFVHLRSGRYDLAAEMFERGLEYIPDSPGVLNNLAVCLIRLGDYEGARKKLNELIQETPNRSTAYFNMAISYVLEQNFSVALDWIRKGADFCTPSQLQSYLSDSDFDSLRSHPEFKQIIQDRFPDIPTLPPPS